MILLKIVIAGGVLCPNLTDVEKPFKKAGIPIRISQIEEVVDSEVLTINNFQAKFSELKQSYGVSEGKRIVHYIVPALTTDSGFRYIIGSANLGCFKETRGASISAWQNVNPLGEDRNKHSLLVVQHEVGHQLGMVHIPSPKTYKEYLKFTPSIMHPNALSYVRGVKLKFARSSIRKANNCLRRKI